MSPPDRESVSPTRSIWPSPSHEHKRITVRRDHREETISISRRVLNACSVLKRELVDGSVLLNFDPSVFVVIVDSVETGRSLDVLLQKPQILLFFAKAWHIARVRELCDVLNNLVDMFRQEYLRLRQSETLLDADGSPFAELRDCIGLHTPAEKFLVDFYAGNWHRDTNISKSLKTMPQDIADHIHEQCQRLHDSNGKTDRIIHTNDWFKLDKRKIKTRQWKLNVRAPPDVPPIPSPRPGTGGSVVSAKRNIIPVLPHSGSPNSLMGRMRVRLEGIFSINGEPEVVPSLMDTFRPGSALSDRAPFMPPTAEEEWKISKELSAGESSDTTGEEADTLSQLWDDVHMRAEENG